MDKFLNQVEEEYRSLRRKQRATGLSLAESGAYDELDQFRQYLARDPQVDVTKYLKGEIKRLTYRQEQAQLSDYGNGSLNQLKRLKRLYEALGSIE